jgi:hypothetical protein
MSFLPPWKLWFAGSIPFKHYLNFHSDTMGYILQAVTWVASL